MSDDVSQLSVYPNFFVNCIAFVDEKHSIAAKKVYITKRVIPPKTMTL